MNAMHIFMINLVNSCTSIPFHGISQESCVTNAGLADFFLVIGMHHQISASLKSSTYQNSSIKSRLIVFHLNELSKG